MVTITTLVSQGEILQWLQLCGRRRTVPLVLRDTVVLVTVSRKA